MKEQAGFELVSCATQEAGAVALEVASLVMPQQQRLSMPTQRLEPLSLRRLFGEPGRLAPARIASTGPASPRDR